MEILKILLLPPPTPTISYRAWAQELREFCALRWYCNHLVDMYGAGSLIVACYSQEDVVAAEAIVAPLGLFVALCESRSRVAAMAELASAFGCCAAAYIGLESMFAPSGLLDAAWAHHRAEDNDFTTVVDLPSVLCPEIVGSRLGATLAKMFDDGYWLEPATHEQTMSTAFSHLIMRANPYVSRPEFGSSPCSRAGEFALPGDVDRARQATAGVGTAYGWELIENWMSAGYVPERSTVPTRPPVASRKRILYLSAGSVYAGAEECQRGLIAELNREAFDGVAVVSAEGLFARRLRSGGCEVIVPNENLLGPRLARNGTTDWNFRLACDVFDLVNPWLVYINGSIDDAFYRAAKNRNLPVVTHVRTAVVAMPERVSPSDLVITVSDYARRCYLAAGIPEEKLERVYDGVDVDRFAPACFDCQSVRRQFRLPCDSFIALMIARCAPNKRHDLAIQAVSLLRRSGANMHLIFAGSPGDPACAAELRQLVRREGLQENVTWMDFQEDVRPLICAADVVILPSDREPLGTCILEGMSLEKPVVVSDAGGTAELMEDGASGLIMRGGDPTSLAGALRRLAENRSFAAELARNGRRRVCEQFSVRAHGMAVSKLLARFA